MTSPLTNHRGTYVRATLENRQVAMNDSISQEVRHKWSAMTSLDPGDELVAIVSILEGWVIGFKRIMSPEQKKHAKKLAQDFAYRISRSAPQDDAVNEHGETKQDAIEGASDQLEVTTPEIIEHKLGGGE